MEVFMSKKIFVAVVIFSFLFLYVSQIEGKKMKPVPLGTPEYTTSQSPCHDNPADPDLDEVIITVSGNDIIVLHRDAFYNCCYTIWVELVQEDNVFSLYEHESGTPCFCMCYFDITTTIYDLQSGTYTINVYNAEGEFVGGGTVTITKTGSPVPALK
jgi:hypothetical protein